MTPFARKVPPKYRNKVPDTVVKDYDKVHNLAIDVLKTRLLYPTGYIGSSCDVPENISDIYSKLSNEVDTDSNTKWTADLFPNIVVFIEYAIRMDKVSLMNAYKEKEQVVSVNLPHNYHMFRTALLKRDILRIIGLYRKYGSLVDFSQTEVKEGKKNRWDHVEV